MATEAKQFAHEALMQLRESLSLSGEDARDQAQALASAVKAWQTTRVEWRYAYGKPVPGARKTLPEAPKTKAKKLNKPPSVPASAPASCGISPISTPQATTLEPATEPQIAKTSL